MYMDSIKDYVFKLLRLDGVINHLSGYVESRIELIKLDVREEVVKVISRGLALGLIVLLALLFLVFISFGLANTLNSYFGNNATGYWIVSSLYGLPCLLLIVFYKQVNLFLENHFKRRKKL